MKRILAATISLIIMILIFGQKVSASETDEYYYGDFTKMNTYLMHRFDISTDLLHNVSNP